MYYMLNCLIGWKELFKTGESVVKLRTAKPVDQSHHLQAYAPGFGRTFTQSSPLFGHAPAQCGRELHVMSI